MLQLPAAPLSAAVTDSAVTAVPRMASMRLVVPFLNPRDIRITHVPGFA